MFGQEPKASDKKFESFKVSLLLDNEYTFTNYQGFNNTGVIVGRLVSMEGDDCMFEVIKSIGTGRIEITDGKCKVNVRMLEGCIDKFNAANHDNKLFHLLQENQTNVAGILIQQKAIGVELARYNECLVDIEKERTALKDSWSKYKEEKESGAKISFPENPRIILRTLIGRIKAILRQQIKDRDREFVIKTIKFCMEYYEYDRDNITNPILAEYGELLEQSKFLGDI